MKQLSVDGTDVLCLEHMAPAEGIGSRELEDRVNRLLDLDVEREVALALSAGRRGRLRQRR